MRPAEKNGKAWRKAGRNKDNDLGAQQRHVRVRSRRQRAKDIYGVIMYS